MDDLDKTMPGRRYDAASDSDSADVTLPGRRYEAASDADDDVTLPGKRDRKPDGRFAVGDLIMNRYKVLAELGQGGMGVVYKCFDETAGIEVALKALPPELSHNTLEMEDIKENFQLVAKLVHQNIAISKNLELDRSNGNYYLIMECVEGEDLRRWLKRKRKEGPLTPDMVLPIIRQVAAALDYAHKEMIIHRDIKPGNIMINSAGDVKVLDFGLAAQIHTSMTRVSMAYHGTSGTGPYMAPEQWRGKAQGAAADQYALAVMTYEMLAGHLPFESTDPAVLREAVLNEPPERLADCSPAVNRAIERAMSKDAADRFAGCSDFVAALQGKKVSGHAAVTRPAASGSRGKWYIIAALLLVIALGGGGYAYRRHQLNEMRLAAEAEAKRLAAEAEKKRRDDLEKEKERQYKQRAELKTTIARIVGANYDRGQTFGKHLAQLQINFDAAVTAMEKNDFALSRKYLSQAHEEAVWIDHNSFLRDALKVVPAQLAEARRRADKYSAVKNAPSLYKNAELQSQSGSKHFEEGYFDQTKREWEAALRDYRAAEKAAYTFLIELHLANAVNAKKEKNWAISQQEAEAVLSLDPSHVEAQRLKADAIENLIQNKIRSDVAVVRQAAAKKQWSDPGADAAAARILKIVPAHTDALQYREAKKKHDIDVGKLGHLINRNSIQNYDEIIELIDRGIVCKVTDVNGFDGLLKDHQFKIAEFMLTHGGAVINDPEGRGNHALNALLAVAKNSDEEKRENVNLHLLQCALDNGARVNSCKSGSWSYLDDAGVYDQNEAGILLIRAMLKNKENINQPGYKNSTALYWALRDFKNKDLVQELVDAGADVNCRHDGSPVLFEAVGDFQIFRKMLDAGAKTDVTDSNGYDLLYHAVPAGNLDVIKYCVEKLNMNVNRRYSNSYYPVFKAPESDNACAVVRYLESKGADLRVQDGTLDLMYHTVYSAKKETLKLFQYLVSKGFSLKKKYGSDKRNLLFFVRDPGVAKTLIQAGLDVNARDNDGKTPLHKCSDAASAEIFIRAGADVNARDNDGKPPLCEKMFNLDVAKCLLKAGADPNLRIPKGKYGNTEGTVFTQTFSAYNDNTKDFARLLVKNGANVNAFNIFGNPLVVDKASHIYYPALVFLVEELGADVNVVDKDGRSALHEAADTYDNKNLEVVKFLVEHGANVNCVRRVGKFRWTPLHMCHDKETRDYLISKGAYE